MYPHAEAVERRVLFSRALPAGSALAFLQQPAELVVGERFAPVIAVGLQDSGGQLLTKSHASVALSIGSGPDAGRILRRASLIGGIATFRGVVFNLAGAYTLQASTGNVSSASSSVITVDSTAPPSTIAWSGPLVITQGGTYSGNWQSLDPQMPAVTIATSQPVVIDQANIESRSTLIATSVAGADITITNTSGWALNPGVVGQSPGRFLSAQNFVNVDIEHDSMVGTSGIELSQYQGDGSMSQTVRVLYNDALNINGRWSSGPRGFSMAPGRSDAVQFCQLDRCTALRGAQIAWNRVVNIPGMSRVEDNISIFQSSGTAGSPILIHDNLIQGAYPAQPPSPSFTGGGILLSDGHTDSAATDTGFVQAFSNVVIGTTNYGIAISSGHDDSVHDNIVVSSGRLPDGTKLGASNVGIYVWNAGNDPFFGNDQEYGNTIGWMRGNGRNDQYLPNVTPSSGQPSDTLLPGVITLATEQMYENLWMQRLSNARLGVGAS
jgi:hypothetical protein